jgi:hypothetical protein
MGDHFKFLGTIAQRLEEPTVITLISVLLAPNSPAPETFPKLSSLYSTLSKNPASVKKMSALPETRPEPISLLP